MYLFEQVLSKEELKVDLKHSHEEKNEKKNLIGEKVLSETKFVEELPLNNNFRRGKFFVKKNHICITPYRP